MKKLKLASSSVYLYLLGTFVSNLGDGIFTLIISKILYDKTGSVSAFGLVLIIQNVASFMLNLLAGYIADIKKPQFISEIADSLRGIMIILGIIFLRLSNNIIVVLMILMLILNF
ncbi:MFS transporter, partial [Lactobacillus crispatus]